MLKLDGNSLRGLPVVVCSLPLGRLDLINNRGGNSSPVLPTELGLLTGLTSFMAGESSIDSIPSTIGAQTRLSYLGLEDNKISEV